MTLSVSSAADIADLPIASTRDDPAEHFLNAWCPRCKAVVDAVCPECRNNVEASGAEESPKSKAQSPESKVQGPKSGDDPERQKSLEFIRRILQHAQSARNSKFTIGCILIAMGHAYAEGVSMAEYARQWGVRRATVSKQCRLICAALGLPHSRYMRDEAICAKFRLSNRRPRKL